MTTRSDIELELVQRASAWLTAASMAVTYAGANASLNAPIGWAIRQSDGTVAAPALVTDADVATLDSADLDQLLDLAELRTLENVLANYALVDAKAGPVEAKSSQLADRLERRINQLRSWIAQAYGIGGYTAFSVQLTRTDGYTDLQATLE
jgi:hypothetical protein